MAPIMDLLRSACWLSGVGIYQSPNVHLLQTLQIRLRMEPPLDWSGNGESAIDSLFKRVWQDREFALDVLDLLLHLSSAGEFPTRLSSILTDGGSEWEVAVADDHLMLGKRMIGPIAEAIDAVRSSSERAHDHLVVAWSKLAGRSPDPSSAYRESIRAVEAAARPIVSPDNDRATLGTVIRDLRAKPEKWIFVLDQADTRAVADLCDLIWKGQVDRHGTDETDAPLRVSLAEADAAFHLSIAAVRIFGGGLLSRA